MLNSRCKPVLYARVFGTCTKITKAKTVHLIPTIRLAQSILKRKYPSVDKPLQKRAFEKYKPRGLFLEFYSRLDHGECTIKELVSQGQDTRVAQFSNSYFFTI